MSHATAPTNQSSTGGIPDSATVAIERAETLEETDWQAAIELLVETNRRARSDEVEMALAALRHRSFERLVEAADAAPPPEPSNAPPVGETGLPEAALDGLTANDVRAAVLEHGSLLVRHALDASTARELAEGIDQSFETRQAYGKLRGRPKDAPRSAWWDPLRLDPASAAGLGRTWVRDGGGSLLADSPRMLFELLELYEVMGLRSMATDYLGSRPVLSANKCTLRRVTTDATGGWHQDGAFLGRGIRAINLWLSLSPCGADAPGLDLVPRRFDDVLETGTGGSYFDWAVGPEVVDAVAGEAGVIRPRFDVGDLLIFDEMCLHRTAVEPEMDRHRHAIETWSFAAAAYPSGQVPLVW